MADVDDGGSAFPWHREWENTRKGYMESESAEGMTLRDYFAARAVSGLAVAVLGMPNERKQEWAEGYARAAYCLADAMLKARAE